MEADNNVQNEEMKAISDGLGTSETLQNQSESVESINNNEKDPIIPENSPKKDTESKMQAVEPVKEVIRGKKREGITINFSNDSEESEWPHLEPIINARIGAGLSINRSHFVKQCIDFAINHGEVIGKQYFGVPEFPNKLLKDAYYNTKDTKIPTCK